MATPQAAHRLALTLVAAAALVACGSSTAVSIGDLLPKGGEVSGYSVDPALPGLQVGKSAAAIEGLVNGDAAPFLEKGLLAFAWNRYASGTRKLDVRVWQMKSAAVASETYDALVVSASLYAANTWTAVSVGDAGRVANTGASYWINVRRGAYLVEVRGTPADDTSRADVEAFAKAIAAKAP